MAMRMVEGFHGSGSFQSACSPSLKALSVMSLQQAGVVFEGADVAPVHLVGVGVEMLVAERLQSGEHPVDLGFLADEGGQCRFLVPARPSLRGVRGAGW